MLERLRPRLTSSVLLWDVLLTLLCLASASYFRQEIEFGKAMPQSLIHLSWVLYVVVGLIWTIVFLLLNPQRAIFQSSLIEEIGRLVASIALASLTFAGLLYLSFRDVSRLQFLYFVGSNLITLLIVHLLIRSFFHFHYRTDWHHRVLIIGDSATGEQLALEFARRPWAGVQVVGYASTERDLKSSLPWLGNVEATPALIADHQIDEIIFALPPNQQERVIRLSLQLQQYPVMVHMVPSVLDLAFARTPVGTLGGIPLISLRESALNESQRMLKRLFDLVASATLLLLFGPLMLLIALLIKLESAGPIFFLQERIGEHGRRFQMIKFRSMYHKADLRWQDVAKRDAEGRLIHKHTDDPRITQIGQRLRRTSLDELPQLFNVLRGEMSLVGPRPEIPYITAEYEPWQWQRFRVPPGMTGWWQINGRSDKPMHLHTEDDLYYIQNYSFWLDLRILFKTVSVVLRGNGAY